MNNGGTLHTILRIVVATATAATCFILVLPVQHAGPRHRWAYHYLSKKALKQKPATVLGSENLGGRDHFEWMRLHEPSTGMIPRGIRERELRFARTLPSKLPSLRKGETGDVAAVWTQRGPSNVGGRTRALALDITNPSVMIAGGASGGIWRSTNAGATWQRRGPGDDVQSTTCLVQDRRSGKTGIWYYGTGELRGNSASAPSGSALYRGDGIFKSTDNGLTWAKLPSTSTGNVNFDQQFDYVWNIALSRSDTTRDIVVAAVIGTIETSTDGGQSWATVLGTAANDNGSRYTDVISTSGGVFYATNSSKNRNSSTTNAVSKGIWRSTDGLTWVQITPPAWPVDYNRVVAAAAPSNENIVYFLAETPGTGPTGHMLWKYTYLSGDGSGAGGLWENRSANLPNESGLSGNAVFSSQISYDLVVAVYPIDPNIVFIGGINLYRSFDGGATPGTWVRIGGYANPNTYARYSNNHPDHHVLVFHPLIPTTLFNGNDGGVYRTTVALNSGLGWTPLNNGYYTTQFYTITLDKGSLGDQAVMGGMQDNGTWYTSDPDGATPWTEVAGGDGSFCAIEPGGAVSYVSFQEGTTYRLTSTSSGRIDPSGGSGYLFINPFILDPAQPTRMYMAGGSTVWRNSDLSAIPMGSSSPATVNWTNMLQTNLTSGSVTALGASKAPAGILYFGTSNGHVYRMNNAFEGKPSAIDVWSGKGFPVDAFVSSIAIDPVISNHVIVTFSNYGVKSIFASTNGGASWTDVSGNLEEQPSGAGNGPSVRWVAILPDAQANHYFVGTSTGLYTTRSLNGTSTTWSREGTGSIGYAVVDMIDVRSTDGTVVVGTHGAGTFSTAIPVTPPSPPPPPAPAPRTLALSANYPNPFNAGTTITVLAPRTARYALSVYDISGRFVRRLADRVLTAGSTPIGWDGRDQEGDAVGSGIYLVVVDGPGGPVARKVTLLR